MAPKQPVAGPSRPRREPLDAQSPPLPAKVSAFNHSRTSFALALPVLGAADKVSVWDVATDRVIAEWEVEGASKVTTICWASTPSTASASTSTSTRKRKKRRKSNGTDLEDVVLITTAKGDLIVFSPERGEVLRKDELPTPVTAAWSDDRAVLFAAASAILVFDPDLSTSPRSFALPANMPTPTAIAVLRTSSSESLELVVGSMSVFTLRVDMKTNAASVMTKPVPVSTSSVASLVPLPSTTEGASFLVVSDDDRTVSQYTVPVAQAAIKLSYRYASTTLSPVHSVAISPNLLSVLHTSGEISLFPIPTELDFSRPRTDSNPSAVKLVEGKDERIAKICRLDFANSEQGITQALICGRMAGAGRVKWHRVVYESPDGGMRRATTVKCDAQDLTSAAVAGNTVPLQRFSASANSAQVPETEVENKPSADLPTDVDMADLSLGQRLLALPNGDAHVDGDAPSKKAPKEFTGPVNAASLTRLLVQALHTSDPALFTLCLSHRDPILIRNTIRKMPAQMALPLLKACVERLGQGKGANQRGGGRGSGQNEQQGRGTVEWVKGVLVERGALLMTIPSLPLHLAALSQLLSTRLQLYQPLHSLSGRLDLALAQISMRRIAAEHAGNAGQQGGEGERYIEGESDEEEGAVPIEVDEEGEVEDVDMRANGLSDEDEGEDDDEGDDFNDSEEAAENDDEDALESGSEDGLLNVEAEESGSDESGSEGEDEED